MKIGYKTSFEGYIFAPHIPIMGFTLPNVKFIGYDKDGKAKFKKIKSK